MQFCALKTHKEKQLEYKYKFDKNNCWFKEKCDLFDTENCREICSRYRNLDFLANSALLSKNQQHPPKLRCDDDDIDSFERLNEIRKNIYDFVNSGKNLVIQSEFTGNGKTSWALKLLMQYISKLGYNEKPRALFINVPKFVMMKKDMISGYVHPDLRYILDNIEQVDLVVWDDIAVTEMTPYDYLNIYVHINTRIDNGKSNIYTSNYVGNKIADVLGDRLYSRVMLTAETLTFYGDDKRNIGGLD